MALAVMGRDFTNLHDFTPTSAMGGLNLDGATPEGPLTLSANLRYKITPWSCD